MTLPGTTRKATLADVARLAGVSATAVSAVMHNGRGKTIRVSQETSKRIHEAAEELGYQANLTARSLATGHTGFIGFMLSSTVSQGWLNPYFSSYLQGAETECRNLGYGLAVTCAPLGEAGKFIHSDILSQRRIDALIVAGELDAETYVELHSSGIPFVVLNAVHMAGLPVIDEPDGFRCIIDYAIAKGHRRIGITRDRKQNTLKGISDVARLGVEVELIVSSEGFHPNWEPGFGLGRHLFERWRSLPEASRPTLLVSNGVLIEFHSELLKAGFKCPDDLSLIGDNEYNFFNSSPSFTRRHIDHSLMGADAVRMLSTAIKRGTQLSQQECAALRYKTEIIEGETVR